MCCVNTNDIVSKITCHSLGSWGLFYGAINSICSLVGFLFEGRIFQDEIKVLGSRMQFHVLYSRVFEQMFNSMISLMTWILHL